MARLGDDMLPFVHIVEKRILHLRTEVDDDLFAALAVNADAAVIKIHIIQIDADAFRYTDTGAQHQSHHGQVTDACPVMKHPLPLGQMFAVLHFIEETGHFIHFETDNFLFVQLRKSTEGSRVGFNRFSAVEEVIEALQRGDLPHDAALCIDNIIPPFGIVALQIFHVLFQVLQLDLIQKRDLHVPELHLREKGIFLFQIFKEGLEIISVGKAGSRRGPGFNALEKVIAEGRKFLCDLPEPFGIVYIFLFMIAHLLSVSHRNHLCV